MYLSMCLSPFMFSQCSEETSKLTVICREGYFCYRLQLLLHKFMLIVLHFLISFLACIHCCHHISFWYMLDNSELLQLNPIYFIRISQLWQTNYIIISLPCVQAPHTLSLLSPIYPSFPLPFPYPHLLLLVPYYFSLYSFLLSLIACGITHYFP